MRLARQASSTHDDSLAQRLLDGLADIPLSDPAAVAAAVKELREGEAGFITRAPLPSAGASKQIPIRQKR